MGIYVASRVSRASMWRDLRAQGYGITSTWIDEAGPGQTTDLTELWNRIAREVRNSSHLVLYAEEGDFPLKGALIEAGMAIGFGVPVFVVLPGVELEQPSCRPIGSWIKHPGVLVRHWIEEALRGV